MGRKKSKKVVNSDGEEENDFGVNFLDDGDHGALNVTFFDFKIFHLFSQIQFWSQPVNAKKPVCR